MALYLEGREYKGMQEFFDPKEILEEISEDSNIGPRNKANYIIYSFGIEIGPQPNLNYKEMRSKVHETHRDGEIQSQLEADLDYDIKCLLDTVYGGHSKQP